MYIVPAAKIAPEYRRLLAEAIRRAEDRGIRVAEGSGLGRTGVWRFTSAKDPPSVSAATRMAKYLESVLPDVRLPPPTVSVVDLEHYEWLLLGKWMLEHNPEGFRRVLDRVRRVVSGERAELEIGIEARAKQ